MYFRERIVSKGLGYSLGTTQKNNQKTQKVVKSLDKE